MHLLHLTPLRSHNLAGRILYEFTYILWPLREGQRTPMFQIHLAVKADIPRPSLWKRLFRKKKEVGCLLEGGGQRSLEVTREQQDEEFVYQGNIIGEIPDALHYYMGDEDFVEKNMKRK